jgi:hypothetical protein
MGLLDVRTVVDRPLAAVFAVYIQPNTWAWCSYMRNVRWVVGRPWEEESRLQIEIDEPVSGIVDQVVTGFEPNARVNFISHFGGVTLITRVKFRAISDHETEIRGHFEFVGTFSRIAGFAIGPALEESAKRFYNEFKRECERVIPQAATRAANPGGST